MLSVPKLKLLTLLLVINISAKLYQSFDSHDIQKYGGSERSNTLQLKKLPSNRKTMKKHIKAMEILKNTHIQAAKVHKPHKIHRSVKVTSQWLASKAHISLWQVCQT